MVSRLLHSLTDTNHGFQRLGTLRRDLVPLGILNLSTRSNILFNPRKSL